MIHPKRHLSTALLCAGLSTALSSGVDAAPRQGAYYERLHLARILIVDEHGMPTAARVQVTTQDGAPLFPEDPEIPVYSPHYGESYFHTDGRIEVVSPDPSIRVAVVKGLEYLPSIRHFTLKDDDRDGNAPVQIKLRRAFDMTRTGWYSGDTHVHMDHGGEGDTFTLTPEDMVLMTDAEDLNLSCVLSNGLYFGAGPHNNSTPEHIVHFAMEYRSAMFGHMALLGLHTLLPDGCCWAPTGAYPSNVDIAGQAHAQNALVILSHPVTTHPLDFTNPTQAWPYTGYGRELAPLAFADKLDALEIFSYSNVSTRHIYQTWYDLLNLGYRVPASAGTDAAMNRHFERPLGGYRVYVQLNGAEFTLENWMEGLRAGRSFVTNGPLLPHFSVQGIEPGGTLQAVPGQLVHGRLEMKSRERIKEVEIVVNGIVRHRVRRDELLGWNRPFQFTLPADAKWIVARIKSSTTNWYRIHPFLEASTSPIYISGTEPLMNNLSRARFTKEIDALTELVESRGAAGNPEALAKVTSQLRQAREVLHPVERNPVSPAGPDVRTMGSASLVERSGNGFRVEGAGAASAEVFDVQGRKVGHYPLNLPARFSWNGEGASGGKAASGIYFVRFSIPGKTPVTKKLVYLP